MRHILAVAWLLPAGLVRSEAPIRACRALAGQALKVAEGVGFEPTVDSHPRRFSRPVLSTTQPPLRGGRTLQTRLPGSPRPRRHTAGALLESGPTLTRSGSSRAGRSGSARPPNQNRSRCGHSVASHPPAGESGYGPARLERLRIAAGRYLPIGLLAGEPDFQIVGLGHREADVARAQADHAVGQFQSLQDAFRVGRELLQNVMAVLPASSTEPARPCGTDAGG